jgi:hypothetical protein
MSYTFQELAEVLAKHAPNQTLDLINHLEHVTTDACAAEFIKIVRIEMGNPDECGE